LFPWIIVVGIFAYLTRLAAGPLMNNDTYFHLRFGHMFLDRWSLQHPGSVTSFASADWVPTQWLPEVVMAKTEDMFGLPGVAWLSGLQLMALATALYLSMRRWAEPLVVSALTVVALVSINNDLSMRPQVLSYLLILLTVTAWMRTQEDGRLRWWLIPMTWLWAMTHGMWPVGIVLGFLVVVGMTLDGRLDPRRTLRAMLIPGLSAVAAGLTPVGPELYRSLFAVAARSSFFPEWGAPEFLTIPVIALGIIIATALVALLRSPGTLSWTDVILFAIAAGCAAMSWRTVPISAMIMAAFTARVIQNWTGASFLARTRSERSLIFALGGLALTILAISVPHTISDPPPEPRWLDPTLSALPADTKVVNEWGWGGYLMWRFPQLDLLMNGYGDTFTINELQRNLDISELGPGWDRELKSTGCKVAVLSPERPLAYALEHQEHWTVVRRSPTIEMLVAPSTWPNGR
jgi:hypothetical protein